MREKWKEVELGEVLNKIIGGGTPSKANESYWNGNIYWCSVKDMTEESKYLYKTEDTISEEGLKNSSANLIKKGTLITATRMGLGRAFIAGVDMAINQDLKALFPNENIDNIFLLYSILFNKDIIDGLGTGATVKGIKLETLRSIKINLPPLETQKKIASILSGYDDLIENNLKRIKILEEMAQQTYEEWFVRMRFPGYETTEINEETGLPEGWEKVKLGEVCNFNQGLQVPIDNQFTQFSDDLIRFIRIVDVTQNTNDIRYVKSPKKLNQFVNFKDVFMVRYGAPQVVTNYKGIIANNFFRININDESVLKSKFLFSFLNRNEIRENLLAMSVSATMPAISFKSFSTIEIILPSIDLQTRFHNDVDMSYDLILNLQIQNQRLREARDILLPRLMMGMVEV